MFSFGNESPHIEGVYKKGSSQEANKTADQWVSKFTQSSDFNEKSKKMPVSDIPDAFLREFYSAFRTHYILTCPTEFFGEAWDFLSQQKGRKYPDLTAGDIESMVKKTGNVSEEIASTGQAIDSNDANTNTSMDQSDDQPELSDADTKKLASLQKNQEDLTDQIRDIDGKITKLQEPIKRQVTKLNMDKSKVQQKLGNVTRQVTDLQKKKVKEMIKEVLMEHDLSKWSLGEGDSGTETFQIDYAQSPLSFREVEGLADKLGIEYKWLTEYPDDIQSEIGGYTPYKLAIPKHQSDAFLIALEKSGVKVEVF